MPAQADSWPRSALEGLRVVVAWVFRPRWRIAQMMLDVALRMTVERRARGGRDGGSYFGGFVGGGCVVNWETIVHVAVEKTTEPEPSHVVEGDPLSGHDPGQQKVGHGRFRIHRTRGQIEDRNISPVGEPEHT